MVLLILRNLRSYLIDYYQEFEVNILSTVTKKNVPNNDEINKRDKYTLKLLIVW